jgi:signal transduction histidine kinase
MASSPSFESCPEQKRLLLAVIRFSFGLSVTASLLYCLLSFTNKASHPSSAVLLVLLASILYFYALIFFIGKNKLRLAATYVVLFYFLVALGCLAQWGIAIGQGLLLLALSITLSGATLGKGFTDRLTLLAGAGIIFIQYAHSQKWISADTAWRSTDTTFSNGIIYAVTFVLFAGAAQMFNQSIEQALHRAIASEEALRKERDSLEEIVQERTKSLQIAQYERAMANQRFADFGRHSASFLHDLANPLSIQLLHMEKLYKGIEKRELADLKETVRRAFSATKRMEHFIYTARKELRQESTISLFTPHEEVVSAFETFSHAAKREKITLENKVDKALELTGNPTRFYKLILNLVSNAIDAFDGVDTTRPRKITVSGALNKKKAVYDFSVKDTGCGIEPEILKKIFEPFYTTKDINKGSGIGMSICKDIAEKDFMGGIEVQSTPHKGTEVKFWIPFDYLSRLESEKDAPSSAF